MRIDEWTLALQAINVLILVWLLKRFLFRPVTDAIAARQAAAEALLADAAEAKTAAEAQQAALVARDEAFAQEAQRRRAEVRAGAEADRVRLVDKAREEAAALAAQAEAAARAEWARQQRVLEDEAAVLAATMAGKLLGRLPADSTTRPMFDTLLDRLRSLPEEDRRKLTQGELQAVTPQPLSDENQARYASALATALPGIRLGGFNVEPDLIAGFELRGGHALVRNSWRADLDDLLGHVRQEADHAGG